jgi:predicted PurR-regulated permease PerM
LTTGIPLVSSTPVTAHATSVSLTPLSRLLLTLASIVAVLAGMRAAAPVIGPVFIALLITIAWSPGSVRLRRHGWHPTVAALTGIVLGVIALTIFVALVWMSLVQLQERLPEYQPRVAAIQQTIAERLAALPIDTSRLFSSETLQPGALVGYALSAIRRLTETAGNLAILVLLMAFMMIEAVRYPEKLRDALASSSAAVERANRFGASMRSYVVINAIFGLIAAVGNTVLLLALGVDFAVLWGVVSFLLSFVPNVGFLIALVPPAVLALVQYGFGRAGLVILGYVVINFAVDTVIKPRFVGESLDLTPIAVVISLVFWGWLLGPVGALIAVPLSIAARFLFESFDESRWLAHLMSDQDPRPSAAATEPSTVSEGG